MLLAPDGSFQLSYCTNIHPGSGWPQVYSNLRHYAPALKRALSPNGPFALGLRLSAEEAQQLADGDSLRHCSEFLASEGLYVPLLNGFPYGSFHKTAVKQNVFAPDWRSPGRLDYTLRLLGILQQLLPAGNEGGISTVPLSYRKWVSWNDHAGLRTITSNLAQVAISMNRVWRETGKLIHLDIEPEPWGLVQNSAEMVMFYKEWLLRFGVETIRGELGISETAAEELLLEHIRVCLDTCHFAVQFEEPIQVLNTFSSLGIRLGRVQISSALSVPLPQSELDRHPLRAELARFDEPTYLHQVVSQRANGELVSYPDLADALPDIYDPEAREWRIHFHVPVFAESYGTFASTQQFIRGFLRQVRERHLARHFEIETYTWDVLPADTRRELAQSMELEYRWVLDQFSQREHAVPAELCAERQS